MKKRVVLEIVLFLALCLLLLVGVKKHFFTSPEDADDVVAEFVRYDDPDILGIRITKIGQAVIDSVDTVNSGRGDYQPGRFEQALDLYRDKPLASRDLASVGLVCNYSIEKYKSDDGRENDVIELTPKDGVTCDLTILCVHGGGYLMDLADFELRGFDDLAQKCHAKAIVPCYDPIFHGTYKEAYELLLSVYRDILAKGGKVALTGSSAGGGLALGFVEYLNEIGEKIPEKLILYCPWIDATLTNPSIDDYIMRDKCLGVYGLQQLGVLWADDLDPSDYRISPIKGDLSKPMPDTLLYTGTEEILYPDAELLYRTFKENGHQICMVRGEGLYHVFMFSSLPEARKANEIAYGFLLDDMSIWDQAS